MNQPLKNRRPMRRSSKPRKRHGGDGGPPSPNRPLGQTYEEVKYLKHLISNQIPVVIRLRSNDEVTGVVEYYDTSFLRLTRDAEPNLFIYKHEIKYLYERPEAAS